MEIGETNKQGTGVGGWEREKKEWECEGEKFVTVQQKEGKGRGVGNPMGPDQELYLIGAI